MGDKSRKVKKDEKNFFSTALHIRLYLAIIELQPRHIFVRDAF